MASLPINLGVGQIIITPGDSLQGIFSTDGKLQFGSVTMVYSGSDKINVGDIVMFDPKNAAQIMYGSTQYLVVYEQYISGTENPVM